MGAIDIVPALSSLYNLVLDRLQGASISMDRTYTSPVRMQHHVW